ncbi:MAG: M23 family metallopeptidase [Lachnospiraceae bacterium]|nr:M23 family metallopeptidase [Lachnospiraceae bacterium]
MKTKKKVLSIIVVTALFIGLLSSVRITADAALNAKCYTIKTGNTTVYSDTGLSKKSGTIYDSDELTVVSIGDGFAKVKYPVTGTNKTKTGYIKSKAIVLKSTSGEPTVAKAKSETYKRPNGGGYGSVAKGDAVYKLGTSGDYVQVMYPVSSGFKIAFVTKTGWKVITGEITLTALSKGLYKNSKAKITCGFDGYTTTVGRHEGIDIAYQVNAPIYSLTDGKVIRVHAGSLGSGGLSTIAIYNSSVKKTVIYLHSKPSVKEGTTVKKGDKIGVQSWRGVTAITGSHTHVEVRDGKEKYAAISVGDSKLENSNPTSFWNSQGYSIK